MILLNSNWHLWSAGSFAACFASLFSRPPASSSARPSCIAAGRFPDPAYAYLFGRSVGSSPSSWRPFGHPSTVQTVSMCFTTFGCLKKANCFYLLSLKLRFLPIFMALGIFSMSSNICISGMCLYEVFGASCSLAWRSSSVFSIRSHILMSMSLSNL